MGTLPGWWLGAADGRVDEPYISVDKWREKLCNAGFNGIVSATYDGYLNNNIIATPLAVPKPKEITLLLSDTQTEDKVVALLERRLEDAGYLITECILGGTLSTSLPKTRDIISVLDLESPFFSNMNESGFTAWKSILDDIQDTNCGILWLTRSCQIGATNPEYGMTQGIMRVLRNEMDLDLGTVELDTLDTPTLNQVPYVLREFQRRLETKDTRATNEWVVRDGRILISRFHYISVTEELKKYSQQTSVVRKLEQHRPGLTETLYWKENRHPGLKADEVQVDIKAVGLNFKVGPY